MTQKSKDWLKSQPPTKEQNMTALQILTEVQAGEPVFKSIRRHPLKDGGYMAKYNLVRSYHHFVRTGQIQADGTLLRAIRMKPMRTLSGVTTVTVLTKPNPCPGNCIFCPDDPLLPKSYLRQEPGAARAFQNHFDPYLQVASRLESYRAIGHPTDKIELLVLGGCWTAYAQEYQEWFIKRCLDALNENETGTLAEAQTKNESAHHRNVGMVIETRPDEITVANLILLRRLGVTKVQLGAQSFNDDVLARNLRGHTAAETLRATALLRAAGFKIVLHWMPNLLGATPDSDKSDFARMWVDGYCPDEIKIYPIQLVESAPLYRYWQDGIYQPYSTEQLIQLIADIKPSIPLYCRVNRIIRDIPADYIVAGSKRSSLRQDALAELASRGQYCRCLRCREVRNQAVDANQLIKKDYEYPAAYALEHFLSFDTTDDRVAGYLRLSLPNQPAPELINSVSGLFQQVPELAGAAIIREVHVYGQSLEVGDLQVGAAQHVGLGTELIKNAEEISKKAGFHKMAVISAIGTREYYRKRGYQLGQYYMTKSL